MYKARLLCVNRIHRTISAKRHHLNIFSNFTPILVRACALTRLPSSWPTVTSSWISQKLRLNGGICRFKAPWSGNIPARAYKKEPPATYKSFETVQRIKKVTNADRVSGFPQHVNRPEQKRHFGCEVLVFKLVRRRKIDRALHFFSLSGGMEDFGQRIYEIEFYNWVVVVLPQNIADDIKKLRVGFQSNEFDDIALEITKRNNKKRCRHQQIPSIKSISQIWSVVKLRVFFYFFAQFLHSSNILCT